MITKNFPYSEFAPKNARKNWRPAFKLQEIMVREMAFNLQAIRSMMSKDETLFVYFKENIAQSKEK